jgi:SAM-dependent methyltransferase
MMRVSPDHAENEVRTPPMRPFIAQLIPSSVKPAARRVYYLPADALDSLLGRRKPLTPPKGKVFFGGGDFNRVGEEYFWYFVELGGLKPDERVLDVGCGIGRMAVPLTHYLDGRGSYEGFDVFPKGVAWCQEHITPKYPNFRFRVANIHNKEYNPSGRFAASEYEFPYEDGSFDFVFLTSVFTHLLPDEVENYLSEIRRVLVPGGRCLASFFLLNEESLGSIRSGTSTIDFRHDFGGYHTKDRDTPEAAIAYPEGYIVGLYAERGLSIIEPIHYGAWPGRKGFLSYQDVVVTLKADTS